MLNEGSHSVLQIGWQEWCSLKELHIPAIKAKIDTGAKTSAIHGIDIRPFTRKGILYAHFSVYPLQHNTEIKIECTAQIVDKRIVMSSNGFQEERYVIKTNIGMGDQQWDMELTLSDREPLRYRLLLGREALKDRVIINPSKLCCLGKPKVSEINEFYYKHIPHKAKPHHAELL